MRNHYEILDVPRDATADQIKAAYRFQLKAFHPDKFSQGSEHARNAQERIHQIVEAYRMLSQASSRAEYDHFLNHTSPLPIESSKTNATELRRRSSRTIYVSATDDLESAEELTLAELLALGYGTVTRPRAEGESDRRPAIQKQIDRCRAVVQLVGRSFGDEPPTIDPASGRVSYTQFEAMYARQQRKAVHYLLISDKFPADAFAQEPDELSRLQKAYRRRLQIVDPHRCPVIDNSEALKVHLRSLKGILHASLAQRTNLLWVPMAAAILVLVGVWFLPTKRSLPRSSSKKLETTLIRNESVPEANSTIAAQNSSPSTTGTPSVFDLPRLARYARKAVVLIMGLDATGRVTSTGSGFFVSDDGRVVTNRHVINNVTSVLAKTEDGAIYRVSGVLADSSSLDLAVLKADAKEVRFLAIQGEAIPEVGSRIAVIGSPKALEGTVSEGIVSAIRTEGEGTWIQITAPISPGSSGSPVLDSNGRVVGIATLNSGGRDQNLNFARSSRDLTTLMQQISERAKPQPLTHLSMQESRPPPSDSPSPTPQITYRVVGLPKRTPFLNIRAGPGANFAVVAVFTPKGRGITLGPGRVTNGTTVWQEVFSGSFHGWVNAEYLEPETPPQRRP